MEQTSKHAVRTSSERAAIGREARRAVPRRSHAGFRRRARRPDPVSLLEQQGRTRVSELLPIRYGRMLASPFAFYRGGAAIMAKDLASTETSGITAQLCGDAHLSNFGAFASPERRTVFDINDFDETLPGPWEWDVKRLATSFEIFGRERALGEGERRRFVLAAVRSYRDAMTEFAGMRELDVWYAHLDVEALIPELGRTLGGRARKNLEHNLAKARTKDSTRAFAKLTHLVDGHPKIKSDPPLIVPVTELVPKSAVPGVERALGELLTQYCATLEEERRVLFRRFKYEDFARKVVGVGSVGTRAWIVLMLGRDEQDPLFLQVKEAQRSAIEPYVEPCAHNNQGKRVVEGQRLMQATSDIFLGWLRARGIDGVERDFYLRQLWDWKMSVNLETITQKGVLAYAKMCGWTLARAHARSGDRIAIAAYLGSGPTFDKAIADFSAAYADQNQADYEAFKVAVESGRLRVQRV